MAPLAVPAQPSPFPLRFSEVTPLRDDFNCRRPGEVVNPKGVTYHPYLRQVIVSLSPYTYGWGERVQILNTVTPDGDRRRFAPTYQMFRDVESLLVVVPVGGPSVAAGFTAGDIFIGRGLGGEISKLSAEGVVEEDIWVDLGSQGLWGGLAFDTTGNLGGRLIALTTDGTIFAITPGGTATLIASLGRRAEGVAVAPAGFGPVSGQIIVGIEGTSDDDPESGKIYAVSPGGQLTLLADIGYAAEDIQFVPAFGATYFQCELSFDRQRENRLLTANASQFLDRLGHMIVVNEMTGELWDVAWDGSNYLQQLVGRVPGRWSSQGFVMQGTELEAGCFAALPPMQPNWTTWAAVPGGGTTDRAPAVGVDASGNLHLLVKGINDRRIYMNNMDGATQAWTGWAEVPPGGLVTNHAVACALHNKVLHAFAIRDDGAIMSKRLFLASGPPTAEPWVELPGSGQTDAPVSATVANGRLVVCAKGMDNQIYLNELGPGGRGPWTGWQLVPGGGHTNVAPAVTTFQNELYIFIKGLMSGHVLTKARSPEDDWTNWAEVPGQGQTDAPIATVNAASQLYIFLKRAVNSQPSWNVASSTGTWSGWNAFAAAGTTDVALAAGAIGSRIYLFARRIADQQLHMRSTT